MTSSPDKPEGTPDVGADPMTDTGSQPRRTAPPSVTVGMTLLVLAAVLIVVVLVQPTMPGWLKAVIGVLAVAVVVALMFYAFTLWKSTQKAPRR